MSNLGFSLIVGSGAAIAGFLGALSGLGGGVIIVPMLALALGVDIRYAVGASLISVIATSSGAAAAYVKEGFTNIRLGIFLEVGTTTGAIVGAWLAGILSTNVIGILFGLLLIYSAYFSSRPARDRDKVDEPDRLSRKLHLDSTFPTPEGPKSYHVHRIPAGFGLMSLAGIFSGLLGIGSGAVKVLAMDTAMRVPFKVSTTTSNFMIGVTAAASAGLYLARGWVEPALAMPVTLGVLVGSLIGARVLTRAKTRVIRLVFSVLILALGAEMIFNGFTGKL